jgi:hypothetical protein
LHTAAGIAVAGEKKNAIFPLPFGGGLAALRLTGANASQVEATIKQLFPEGTSGMDQGEVIRAVFVHLKRQHSGDNVGR